MGLRKGRPYKLTLVHSLHENSSVKFSVKKIDGTIVGHHIGSLRRIAVSA